MKAFFIAAVVLLLASCIGPEQVEDVKTVLQPLVDKGTITKEQLGLVVNALTGGGGIDWGGILSAVGQGAATLIAGYLGINVWRGSPNKRKGSAPQ